MAEYDGICKNSSRSWTVVIRSSRLTSKDRIRRGSSTAECPHCTTRYSEGNRSRYRH